jgi:small nuclear ribonucleoprotein (snRNP)-like protein
MNLVIDEAVEVTLPTKDKDESRRNLGIPLVACSRIVANSTTGRILLKGDNVSLIQMLNSPA